MKKFICLFSLSILACACASNVDKANKLIDQYMYKHLHDYKSYEVVETTVDTLFNSPVTDPDCIDLIKEMKEHFDKKADYDKEAEYAERSMDIWSGGYSSTSRNEYNKAYKEWATQKRNGMYETISILQRAKELLVLMEDLDGKKQVGWIADHTFRSNTRAGASSLGNYSFFIDKDFKNILYTMDEDDSEIFSEMPAIIGYVKGLETPAQADSLINGWNEVIAKYTEIINR